MTHSRHTQAIEPLTEEADYGWTPRAEPPRCRRDWRPARDFAWMCAGFALAALFIVVGIILLDPSVVHR